MDCVLESQEPPVPFSTSPFFYLSQDRREAKRTSQKDRVKKIFIGETESGWLGEDRLRGRGRGRGGKHLRRKTRIARIFTNLKERERRNANFDGRKRAQRTQEDSITDESL